jgi:hypothetical protein
MMKEKEVREGECGWKERYDRLMEVERGYVKHMKWINSYNKGEEVKRRRKRGSAGPLMRSMLLEEGSSSSSSEEEMDEKDQLVYVLPKEDTPLLKEAGIEISKINEEMYESEKEYECAYKTNIWEGKAKLRKIRKKGKKEGEYNIYSGGNYVSPYDPLP